MRPHSWQNTKCHFSILKQLFFPRLLKTDSAFQEALQSPVTMRRADGVGSHLVQWKTKCLALSQKKAKVINIPFWKHQWTLCPRTNASGRCARRFTCAHMCTHTVTWWSRKSSQMGRSKAQQDIPVTLALVSNTSMSISKYEGSLESLQMEDKQKLEKKNLPRQLIFLLWPFHLPWAALVHCQSLPHSTLKYDSVPESYGVVASLAWSYLFKPPALRHSPKCLEHILGIEGNTIPDPGPDGY